MRNQRGFSMIELVLVMVIVGILTGIATITVSAWMDKAAVESQTRMLYIDILNARVSAMQKNREHFVDFQFTPTYRYTVYEDTNPEPDGNGEIETDRDGVVVQKNLDTRYVLHAGTDDITFDTRGLTKAGMQTIHVLETHNSAYNCIVISATQVRIGGWNGSDCVTQ